MKLSDYVMRFLAEKGISTLFYLPGGGCMHLVNSLAEIEEIKGVSLLHEQAAAIAAESYAFAGEKPGALLVTTGPGGTNAITGVLSAYIDSMPVFVLSGQVKTSDLKSRFHVRALGSQEADIVSMVKEITKYAVMVTDPKKIRFHLEKAWYEMNDGKKGPVWIDLPLDIQGTDIDPEALEGFIPEKAGTPDISASVSEIISMLEQASRPVIMIGNGVRPYRERLYELLERLQIPVIPSWKGLDLMHNGHPLYIGRCGSLGERAANFAMQTSDFILSLGCRLDFSITGFDQSGWAKNAKKAVVDVDAAELRKLEGASVTLALEADAGMVIEALLNNEIHLQNFTEWKTKIAGWKQRYPILPAPKTVSGLLSTYEMVEKLCEMAPDDIVFVPTSSGTACEIFNQGAVLKKGQVVRSNHGLGAMGFEIPASIGACVALGRMVFCIAGDGGMQLNIQELASIAGRKLPVKIFVVNNNGYASIRGMQRTHFEGHYFGSNRSTGLFLPDSCEIARAYGIAAMKVTTLMELEHAIQCALETQEPFLCDVVVDPMCTVSPKTASRVLPDGSMASSRLEDLSPFLPAEVLEQELSI